MHNSSSYLLRAEAVIDSIQAASSSSTLWDWWALALGTDFPATLEGYSADPVAVYRPLEHLIAHAFSVHNKSQQILTNLSIPFL